MQGLPYFVRPALKKAGECANPLRRRNPDKDFLKKDVERFSDRLHAQSHVSDQILDWKPGT